MAGLQSRNGSWRVIFWFKGKQHTYWLGEVEEPEARTVAAKVDYWLMRLKQNLVHLPSGCDILSFVRHDGSPPDHPQPEKGELTLAALNAAYASSQKTKLEETTLAGIRLHFAHLQRILGAEYLVPHLTRADLQAYVNKRSKEWIDPNVYRRKRREKHASKPIRKNRKPAPPEAEDKPLRHPSSATIRKEIISLRTAWNWARRHLGLRKDSKAAVSIT